ncbi:uncharacterized protein N7473_007460 [Penicillium subrubescens]|uniref:uncharacterized protein n=1 Tax=Penicillium subrubescens TaxID=1316194 RepID=UPI002545B1E0|nr:uncharacterized protein N7473_007460 [Penicillium subrubescens]KAJ5891232.1 hypothetical protein N7473_007460 [Penicillium subrubescens]
MLGNGSGYSLSSISAFSWVLKNPDTGQDKTSLTSTITFSAYLNTSLGNITVLDIQLAGRQSKILVTDYKFGNRNLPYSSTGEFAFKTLKNLTFEIYGASSKIKYTQAKGSTILRFLNGYFWAPLISIYLSLKPDQRYSSSARIWFAQRRLVIKFFKTTTLEAFVGDVPIKTTQWNTQRLGATNTLYGSYTAQIPGTEYRSPGYNNSRWIVANETSSLSTYTPLTLPVLFSSDYSYYTGAKIYRGYFDGNNQTTVNITASGGLAFRWNVWLNGQLIGGYPGDPNLTTLNITLKLLISLLKSKDNVLTVLVDYYSYDETSTA